MKLSNHKRSVIIILIVLLFLFGAKAYYDTNSIEVKHYQLKNSELGEVLNGLKVALLSDLHIKAIGLMEKKILEILKNEKPDLIFITGDFISFQGPYEPVLSFFQQLRAPYGIYGVFGNTEYSNENGSCILCHEERSKRLKEKESPVFLRNSFSKLNVNGKIINIFGVNDPVHKRSNLKATLQDINSQNPSILLTHSPEIFEEASKFGIDLVLCGHTHGGQLFLTKYVRKIIPLEASLEFIDGFFQKGKMLMYVSRGVGTSYLPFRLGVKPEITFFTFANNTLTEKVQTAQIGQMAPTQFTAAQQHSNTAAPSFGSLSNTPPMTFFIGLSLSNLIETFNVFQVLESLGLIETRAARSTPRQYYKSMAPPRHGNKATQEILFDFESEEDLKGLDWECHKWFELSQENATSGKYSLKVLLPPGQYPGIMFRDVRDDWSEFGYLKMDVFNPSEEAFNFHVRIDDNQSGLEYANRFDADFNLKPGLNNLSIPTSSIQTNLYQHPLNLKRVKGMMVFLTNNTKPRELYLDNIRLE